MAVTSVRLWRSAEVGTKNLSPFLFCNSAYAHAAPTVWHSVHQGRA